MRILDSAFILANQFAVGNKLCRLSRPLLLSKHDSWVCVFTTESVPGLNNLLHPV